jgi:hypothetical protein
MTRMRSSAVAIPASIGHFTSELSGAFPNLGAPVSFLVINRSEPAGLWVPWGQPRRRKANHAECIIQSA